MKVYLQSQENFNEFIKNLPKDVKEIELYINFGDKDNFANLRFPTSPCKFKVYIDKGHHVKIFGKTPIEVITDGDWTLVRNYNPSAKITAKGHSQVISEGGIIEAKDFAQVEGVGPETIVYSFYSKGSIMGVDRCQVITAGYMNTVIIDNAKLFATRTEDSKATIQTIGMMNHSEAVICCPVNNLSVSEFGKVTFK